jgi:hypothetical protein
MRFHKVCLLFLTIVAGVFASKAAGAWQVVGWYNAYRIMIDAYGVDGNKYIAKDARGSLPDKSCTMDEFAKYIYGPKGIKGWPDKLIGSSVAPDPVDAVAKIEGSEWRTSTYWMPKQLLPGLYNDLKSGVAPPLTKQVEDMSNYVQQARTAMNTKGITEAEVAAKPEFKNLKTSLVGISQMRRKDLYSYNLQAILGKLTSSGFVPVTVEITALDGVTKVTQIDSAATIEATIAQDKNKKISVADIDKIIENLSIQTRNHYPVIQSLDKWTSDIDTLLQC